MKVGIVGFGHVGKAMNQLFPEAAICDEPSGCLTPFRNTTIVLSKTSIE
ncbi:hypothetical protein ACFPVX_21910 [Cohnella faecalis]|nr:hypothetical protein [Cohnella faecalis]